MEERQIGLVEIISNQRELHEAMAAILFVNLFVLVIASILAVFISIRAQKSISGPVNTLAKTMAMVSRDKDYSVRVTKQSEDELGTLFDMFNGMLSEIQERDDRLRFIQYSVDHMQDAIFWTDSDANIISANQKACDLVGYTKEEILSMTLFDFYPKLTPQTWKEIWEYILKEKNISAEVETLKKDGTSFPSEVFVSNIEFNGKLYNCSFIRDVTDKHRLKAQLEQAQKLEAIGTLAGGVAHDLNNILGGLVGYPDLLLMEIPEESPLVKPLMTIKKSGEKAAAIVQDMLTLARRNVDIQKVVNLNDVINDYLKSPEHIKIMEFHPGINITVNLDRHLPNITGSSVHLSKAIMNLVSNAAEALTDEEREIFISTHFCYLDADYHGFQTVTRGGYSIVTVEDRGTGISKEDQKMIFEPFYTKKIMGRSGTGLGMTVVSGVVKDHRGFIDIESIKGKCTRFDLYFPSTDEKKIEEGREISLEACRGNETILVVDDVEEQRDLAAFALKKLGYNVATVRSGEEAIDFLRTKRADLIILDMIMEPGMDGLETYRKVLEIRPFQKAIISSGFAENSRVKEALNLGAGAYVKKPYTAMNLGLAVRKELDRRIEP
jgi:PAS domain S-box-containing protein